MDDVPMAAYLTQAGGDRDRLVRDDPRLPAPAIHLHRKSGGWVERANAALLERGHDAARCFVQFVARVVKLEIRHGARRGPQALAVHPQHESDERARRRKERQDLALLRGDFRPADGDEPDIRRADVETQLPQPRGVDDRSRRRLDATAVENLYGGMVFEPSHGRLFLYVYTSIGRKKSEPSTMPQHTRGLV